MHPKYEAAKEALRMARSPDTSNTSKFESLIERMHESSEIPCTAIEDYLRSEYNKHEPHRKGYFIKQAIGYARGNNIGDGFEMEESLKEAEKHSSNPLRQKVYDFVFSEYKKHEPERLKRCLSAANMYAKGSITHESDWGQVEEWLEFGRQHTNGFKSKVTHHLADQAIRTKYVFFHLPQLVRGYS